MNKNTMKKSALFLAAGLSLSFSAVSAAPAHAAGYGDQYIGWSQTSTSVDVNQGSLYVAPADTQTPVSDVYCFNIDSEYPGHYTGADSFTKKLGTANLFEQAATNEILQGDQLRAAVLNTIYNGYPNNASGLQEYYGLSDAELRSVTQEAIWYFTDGETFDTASEENSASANRYAELAALNNLIGKSNEVQLVSAPANMSLDLYIPENSTVQNLLGATFVPAAPEETVEIGTTASDKSDKEKVIAADGGIITDVVDYTGLKPGTEYTLTGKVMEKLADGSAKETGITASKKFTAETTDGQVSLDFTVPASYAGMTLVVFEKVTQATSGGTVEVATHEDINSTPQTVTVEKAPTSSESPKPSTPVETPAPSETPSTPVEQPSEEPTPGDIEMPQTDERGNGSNQGSSNQGSSHQGSSNQGSSNQGGSAVTRSISRMLPNTGNDVTAGGLLAGLGLVAAGAASIVVGRKRK